MPHPRIAAFLQALADHRLLDAERLGELSGSPAAQGDDLKALARFVLDQGWLTRHQINLAAQGRAKDLRVGPYLVIDKLGEGGMGQVFKARHETMRRVAALKVIRKEKLGSPRLVERFYQEVQAAARLHHPNVVVAYDAQQAGDVFYFAMEYVDGVDLSRLVRERGVLPAAEACEYARQAALGLQHAHERGMVHRDVKPHNLIVAEGGPGGAPVVKVLDMGLARLNGAGDGRAGGLTQTGQVMGTPDFLAPEQAVDPKAADVRSDLYGLGCTLYFLLAGRAPFRADTLAGVLLQHQMEEPPPLRQRRPDVPPGVEAVVRKLMAKKPADRYQTPAEAAAALEPFCRGGAGAAASGVAELLRDVEVVEDPWDSLGGEPAGATGGPVRRMRSGIRTVTAAPRVPPGRRPPADRSRLYLVAAASGGLLLAGLAALVIALAVRSKKTQPDAEGAAAPPTAPATPVARRPEAEPAPQPAPPAVPVRQAPAPETLPPAPSGRFPFAPLPGAGGVSPADALNASLARPEDRPPGLPGVVATVRGHTGQVRSAAFSADGRWLATGGSDQAVVVLDLARPRPWQQGRIGLNQGAVTSVCVAPDGKALAWATDADVLTFADVSGPKPRIVNRRGASPTAQSVVFSPDGRTLAAAHGGGVRLWEVTGGDLGDLGERGKLDGAVSRVNGLAFSPDGKALAAGGDTTVRLWDLGGPEPRPRITLAGHAGDVWTVGFSPDGKALAVTTKQGAVWLWDLSGPAPRERARWVGLGPREALLAGTAPDGRSFVTLCGGRLTRWDFASGEPLDDRRLPGPASLWAYAAGGRYAAHAPSGDPVVHVLRLDAPPVDVPPPPPPPLPASGGSPLDRLDPAQIAVADRVPLDGLVAVARGHTDEVWSVAFAPDGKTLASGGKDQTVRLWDLSGAAPRELAASQPLGRSVRPVAFGPGGKTVTAGAERRSGVRVLDATAGLQQRSDLSTATALAHSPDGGTMAEAQGDGTVRLWDVRGEKPRPLGTLRGHTRPVYHLAFGRDGRTLASTGSDHTVRVWDASGAAAEAKAVLALPAQGRALDLAVSPDGAKVAAGHTDGGVYWWDVGPPPRERPPLRGHSDYAHAVAFSPDGRYLLSSGGGLSSGRPRFTMLWDVVGGGVVRQWRMPERTIGAAFSPDGRYLALGCHNRCIYVFRLFAAGAAATPAPAAGDADRAAAVWALGRGFHVQVDTGEANNTRFLTRPGDLPAGPFKVVALVVTRAGNAPPVDDDLSRLRGLTALRHLNLANAGVTDAGLAHLEGLPALAFLFVTGSPGVTDAGVPHLAQLPALRVLVLSGTKVTGAGLAPLKGRPLTGLNLSDSAFTDADLAQLPDFPQLTMLDVHNTKVTDAGLKEAARLPSLQTLNVSANPVGGAGLARLAGHPRLSQLTADDSAVDDAALRALAVPNLFSLSLAGSRVTDAGLAELSRFPKLHYLNLSRTAVTDRGMATLARLEGLTNLLVDDTAVGDEGLDQLAKLPRLAHLNLTRAKATDAGRRRLQSARPQLKIFP